MHKYQFRKYSSLWERARECRETFTPEPEHQPEAEDFAIDANVLDESSKRTTILQDLVASMQSIGKNPDVKAIFQGNERLNAQSTQRMGFLQDILQKAGIEHVEDIGSRVEELNEERSEALFRETMAGLARFDPSLTQNIANTFAAAEDRSAMAIRSSQPFDMRAYPLRGAPYAINARQAGPNTYAAAMQSPNSMFAIAQGRGNRYPVWPQAYPGIRPMPTPAEEQHRMELFRKVLGLIIALLLMLLERRKDEPVVEDEEEDVTFKIREKEAPKEPEKAETKPEPEKPKAETATGQKPEPEKPKEQEKPKESPEQIVDRIIALANTQLEKEKITFMKAQVKPAERLTKVQLIYADIDGLDETGTAAINVNDVNGSVEEIVKAAKAKKLAIAVNPAFIEQMAKPGPEGHLVKLRIDGLDVWIGKQPDAGDAKATVDFAQKVGQMRVQIAKDSADRHLLVCCMLTARATTDAYGIILKETAVPRGMTITFKEDIVKEKSLSFLLPEKSAEPFKEGVQNMILTAQKLKTSAILDSSFTAALTTSAATKDATVAVDPANPAQVIVKRYGKQTIVPLAFDKPVTETRKAIEKAAVDIKQEILELSEEQMKTIVLELDTDQPFKAETKKQITMAGPLTSVRKIESIGGKKALVSYGETEGGSGSFEVSLASAGNKEGIKKMIFAEASKESDRQIARAEAGLKTFNDNPPFKGATVKKMSMDALNITVEITVGGESDKTFFYIQDAAKMAEDISLRAKIPAGKALDSEEFKKKMKGFGLVTYAIGGNLEITLENTAKKKEVLKPEYKTKAIADIQTDILKKAQELNGVMLWKPEEKDMEKALEGVPANAAKLSADAKLTFARKGKTFTFSWIDDGPRTIELDIPDIVKNESQLRFWIYECALKARREFKPGVFVKAVVAPNDVFDAVKLTIAGEELRIQQPK